MKKKKTTKKKNDNNNIANQVSPLVSRPRLVSGDQKWNYNFIKIRLLWAYLYLFVERELINGRLRGPAQGL